MQDMKRFARFWDIVYNSGNFVKTSKLLLKMVRFWEFLILVSGYKEVKVLLKSPW